MSATVETLHPGAAAPAIQVIAALEQMASSLIGEQLGKMFESADDVLFEMADKARDPSQKHVFLTTMRMVRLERPRLVKSFQQALHEALRRSDTTAAPAEVDLNDLEKWTLQESSDLEEKIAVSNMDSKAASMYARDLMELEQRLTRLSDDSHGAVSPKALCPARILDAFRLSMKGLDVDLPVKLVIYKLFDRVVVGNLGQVFHGANQVLEAHGVHPKASAEPVKKSNVAMWKPAAPAVPAPDGSRAASAVQSYLQSHAGGSAGGAGGNGGAGGAASSYQLAQQNAQLADEMLSVLDAAGHGRPVDSWMPTQNLTLVSRMFDDFYADPQLPEGARPVLGKLQFPVMKYAMSDRSFFSNPNHPVRNLVQDVYDNLTSVRGTQSADFHQVDELVQDLMQRFDPDPARLRQRAREVHPVTEEEAEHFLEQQRQRFEQQKKALQEKIRRIVAQELRLHLGDRRLPKPVLPLILSGFGPMLVVYYRAGGQDHPDWIGTLALLDRVLAAVDAAAIAAPGRQENETAVLADIVKWLTTAGFATERIQHLGLPFASVCEELAAAAEMAAAPGTAPPADAPDVAAPLADCGPATGAPVPVTTPVAAPSAVEQQRTMQMLLRPGLWFKVWSEASHNCRWLKLTGYYAGADLVMFEDFGGEQRLKMSAAAFVQDLAAERSCPVDPDASFQRQLKLLPVSAEPLDPQAEWLKADKAPAAAAA